jgi:hypothetical protein
MIYVASPYTHRDEHVMQERYEAVCGFCAQATCARHFVYSPIAHWHPIAQEYFLPRDAVWWSDYNEHMLKLSHQLWVIRLDGWVESKGVLNEVRVAKENAIKVSYYLKGGTRCTK